MYEDVEDIADEIERPAMIRDASRSEVEALYEFQSLMASGGSAAVWRAVERATGRAVAIKVIDKKLLLPSLLNMEVYAMQRCSGHPNIAALLAAFDLPPDEASPDGEWHLVMELAEGGELFERLLQHGAYTEKVASDLLKQIASAVYHLHSCGVTHRDIKPENIVLMSDDEAAPVKLIDFGAALVLEEGEQVIRGGKVGTWTYWAPELADEDVPYDQAVDMWGLGVVLYIMLSGRHPFEKARASADDVLQGILDANYSFDSDAWNGVSGRAKELVARMLEKDPEKRMTAAELLSHSWVRGERVPERPLPDTQERLRAFKKATTAIHASLLLAVLLHQDSVLDAERSVGDSSGADGGKRVAGGDQGSRLRRSISISEGVGLRGGSGSSEDFNPLRAAYRLFDPTAKGHISAGDLQRVCSELGVEVSERDVENMLSVLAPSATTGAFSSSKGTKQERMISYDKFSTMLQSSFQRTFDAGTAIFEQGDEVRGFYIIQKGECVVQARAAPDAPLREVTRLGAGDFFGETGLLEGRGRRNTTVTCATPVEVLMIDSPMFMELQSSGKGVAQRMRDRLGRRQRTRLRRAIELSQPDGRRALQRVQYKAGETVFAQGDAASHFYIVSNGTLAAEFTASTGERARLRTLGAGDQIGHDAMLGECHDTTVRCVTDATLLAVPRDSLQHALTTDSYLQSVWQAPAVDAIELRRQASQTLHSPAQVGRKGAAAAAVSKLAGSVAAGADSGTDTRLPADEFAMLLHRARPIRLENGECAIEQGSTPEAVFLLESGQVDVEYTIVRGRDARGQLARGGRALRRVRDLGRPRPPQVGRPLRRQRRLRARRDRQGEFPGDGGDAAAARRPLPPGERGAHAVAAAHRGADGGRALLRRGGAQAPAGRRRLPAGRGGEALLFGGCGQGADVVHGGGRPAAADARARARRRLRRVGAVGRRRGRRRRAAAEHGGGARGDDAEGGAARLLQEADGRQPADPGGAAPRLELRGAPRAQPEEHEGPRR